VQKLAAHRSLASGDVGRIRPALTAQLRATARDYQFCARSAASDLSTAKIDPIFIFTPTLKWFWQELLSNEGFH
jgi:hypothetical protein